MNEFPSFDLSGQVRPGHRRGARPGPGDRARPGASPAPTSRSGCATRRPAATWPREIEALGRRALRRADGRRDPTRSRAPSTTASRASDASTSWSTTPASAPENPAEDVTEADFDPTVDVNLKGTFFVSQAAGRVMIGQGDGRIVNLELAGRLRRPARRVGLLHDQGGDRPPDQCLAVEWGRHGITVNAVAPTFIRTPGTEAALADPAFQAEVVERIAALHRIGEPMEVAGRRRLPRLAGGVADHRDTLLIDGGWTAR